MTEDEIQKLADLIFDRIMEQQENADAEYAEQIQKLVSQGYTISDITSNKTDELGLNNEVILINKSNEELKVALLDSSDLFLRMTLVEFIVHTITLVLII